MIKGIEWKKKKRRWRRDRNRSEHTTSNINRADTCFYLVYANRTYQDKHFIIGSVLDGIAAAAIVTIAVLYFQHYLHRCNNSRHMRVFLQWIFFFAYLFHCAHNTHTQTIFFCSYSSLNFGKWISFCALQMYGFMKIFGLHCLWM